MAADFDNVAIIPEVPTAVRILSNGPIYHGTITRTSQPTNEPISISLVKAHVRIDADNTAEDTLLGLMITAARQYCEGMMHRTLVKSTYKLTLDQVPNYNQEIYLPYPPLISVDSAAIHLRTGDNTINVSTYLDIDLTNGKIKLNREWYSYSPDITPDLLKGFGAFEINCSCGMATDVPNPAVLKTIQLAMLMIIGHWYDHRDAITENRCMTEVPHAAIALLDQYRIFF